MRTFELNALEFLFIIVTSSVGSITILNLLFKWITANKLYKIEEQELRDSYGDVWFSYIKYYKILGITFKTKRGPFRINNNESVDLKCKIMRFKEKEEEAKLKASLKPVIKLDNKC